MTGPARRAEDSHCGHWLPTGRTCAPATWTPRAGQTPSPSDPPPRPLAPRRTVLLAPQPARAWAPSSRDAPSPRCTVPGFSGTSSVRLCPGSEVPAVHPHARELVPPTTDWLVKATHRAGRWRHPPGRTRCPMPAPPPGLPWGVVSRCQHCRGQLWAPGSQTWGPAEGR